MYIKAISERASKGQGGNKEIITTLFLENKFEVGRVVMTYNEFEGYKIYYYPINENCTEQKINSGRVLLYETKDKKQKTVKCEFCGKTDCDSLLDEETICKETIPF